MEWVQVNVFGVGSEEALGVNNLSEKMMYEVR